jgi:hypothetical protein
MIMKNSQSNPANVVVTTETTTKQKAQHAAVTAVKVIVYPAHLVCQTAADLLCIGQAQVINKIDGTPVFESMMDQQSWTQHQQAKVVAKGMEVKARIDARREANRQQHIDRLKRELDKQEGVQHVTITEPIVVVPAPPVNKKQGALAKAMDKVEQRIIQNTEVPLMSPNAVFAVESVMQ